MQDEIKEARDKLAHKANKLQHIIDVGIEDTDWYHIATSVFVVLDSIDINDRTADQTFHLDRLLQLICDYEEKYYGYVIKRQ